MSATVRQVRCSTHGLQDETFVWAMSRSVLNGERGAAPD